MKKIISILLVLMATLLLVSCSGSSSKSKEEKIEYHAYYDDFVWGMPSDEIIKKLEEKGFKYDETVTSSKIKDYNISQKLYTIDKEWGNIFAYNAEYLDEYKVSIKFDIFSDDPSKRLLHTYITFNDRFEDTKFDELEEYFTAHFGESSFTKIETSPLYQRQTDWKTTDGMIRLIYWGGKEGGSINVYYFDH